jgi:methylthioribose-1-phosphate isomerase
VYLTADTEEDCFDAILKLKVRGAPCIGIFAGYAMYVLCQKYQDKPYAEFAAEYKRQSAYLNSSRPTAVNLSWALKRMEKIVEESSEVPVGEIVEKLGRECVAIHEEDIAMCSKISEYGLSLIKEGDGILTHCNAGPLATSRYGTALGPMFLGKEKGMNFRVFADETRPLLQGARLTSYELQKAGIDVTLICDNMASIVMRNGWIQACFVGCDRIAANGDFANKIGTSGVAILAKHYGIPVYTLGPSSTIDMNCPDGEHIEIELRDPNEIKEKFYAEPMALKEVKCYNPAFDVTDHELLAGIVTEKGIVRPPFDVNLKKLFG